MAKLLAVTLVLIAIGSAIPIIRHTWVPPQDISTHGALIDEQMADTMAEAGVSFLAAQILLGIFIWKFSGRKPNATIGNFRNVSRDVAALALAEKASRGELTEEELAGLQTMDPEFPYPWRIPPK